MIKYTHRIFKDGAAIRYHLTIRVYKSVNAGNAHSKPPSTESEPGAVPGCSRGHSSPQISETWI